jgi:hypothetical protein
VPYLLHLLRAASAISDQSALQQSWVLFDHLVGEQ